MTRVAIIGAGITGLVSAFELQKLGVEVTLFEAADRVGGPISTVRRDGWVAERGPHTLLESNDTLIRVIDELGLASERVYANAASHKRFVVKGGQPRALPMGPRDLLRTDVFSPAAKLRLAREPFVPRRDDDVDESLTMFATRRFGRELLEYGFELMVNGVWAGDPNRLSVRHAFPKMYALEREYGSVIGGALIRARRGGRRPSPMFSFRDGNDRLPQALAEQLDDVRLQTPVDAVRRADDGWSIGSETFDAVLVTVSAAALANMTIDGANLDFFREIAHPSVSIVTLGYPRGSVAHPLDGFGMIAPQAEGLDILGTLFTSSLFDGRAPRGHVTLASFVGGLRRPDLADLPDDDLVDRVRTALEVVLGARGRPKFVEIARHPEAIPQYEVGHGRLFAQMDALERSHPGLYVGGNVRQGVSVPDLVQAGAHLATRIRREVA